MKYIRIKNNGLIEPQALYLVGASSKRNDTTKVGKFGSGLKFALAYLLRNQYEVKVFSGKQEIVIDMKPEMFRGQEFNVIYINGEKTSITTGAAIEFQLWEALREVYANGLDEGGCSMDFVQTIDPLEDQTHFYIATSKGIADFVTNFDNYFATNKKILFECKDGKILEKSGSTANVYRKDIRCFNTNKTSLYDYSLTNIDIDENRLVKYSWLLVFMVSINKVYCFLVWNYIYYVRMYSIKLQQRN